MSQNMAGAGRPMDELQARYAIKRLMEKHRGDVIFHAQQLAEQAGWRGENRMKNTQLHQLKAVAQQAQSIGDITEWVEYQASRLDAWSEVKKDLLASLESSDSELSMRYLAHSLVERHPELATYEDQIWLDLCRLFTGYLQRRYVIWHGNE